ncbi:Peptidase S8 subtilisin-related [Carpediemonas membranifera]|uniref:Peptidase S8 subtilisin-related n=1 Tax=Carpediemonas membranifera TaxID=201153 RepID=A0A8J6B9A0_9EUKA|nr:Peptidase S8 subtilisin-related [Carpediemonas membranifera]|eukprot:KAG9395447.1 Peptidase S8 subtilisin-related [Carpediemonas membranifera]
MSRFCLLLAVLLFSALCHEFDGRLLRVELKQRNTDHVETLKNSGLVLDSIEKPNYFYFYCDSYNISIDELAFIKNIDVVQPFVDQSIISDEPAHREASNFGLSAEYLPENDLPYRKLEHIVLTLHRAVTDDEYALLVDMISERLRPITRVEHIGRQGPGDIVLLLPPTARPSRVAGALADVPHVRSMERISNAQIHNIYAASNIQGTADSADEGVAATESRPFFDLGVKGNDIVVGCGDTGVDMNHCFFHDESVPMQYNTDLAALNHRKLVYYHVTADTEDGNGHGTHVSGSILGTPAAAGAGSMYGGMAPNAKLFFTDLGSGTSSSMTVPSNLYASYFSPAASYNATVHSSSWSFSASSLSQNSDKTYDSYEYYVDLAAYNLRNMTILLSAGNDGGEVGPWSVASPSAAKNAITVGATSSGWNAFVDEFCNNSSYVAPEGFTNENMEDYCHYADSQLIPMWQANSLASFSSLGPAFDGRTKPDIVAPGYYIVSARYERPTASASCDLTADFVAMAGTSMATPVTAGAVALLQEYISRGFHGDGTEGSATGFMPSSAMVRAALIATAQDMAGVQTFRKADASAATVSLASGPNNSIGWGRLGLGNLLNLAVILKDESDLTAVTTSANVQAYDFTVNSVNEDINVGLAWIDPPAASGSKYVIVNNLVLWVKTPSGLWYTGNFNGPATRDNIDNYNINQRVRIPASELSSTGTYTIFVEGTDLYEEQPYALAVWGDVDRTSWSSSADTLPANPGGCNTGTESSDKCSCPAGKGGDSCTYPVYSLTSAGIDFDLTPGAIAIVEIPAGIYDSIAVQMTKTPYVTSGETGRYVTGALVDAIVSVDDVDEAIYFAAYDTTSLSIPVSMYSSAARVTLRSRDGWNTIGVYVNKEPDSAFSVGISMVLVALMIAVLL